MRALLDREHIPIDNLADVDTVTTAPVNNYVLTWSSANGTWQPAAAPGATGGEANTGSNQGIDGVGVYDTKVGVDLQFRNVAPASNKITVNLNGKDIDIDVAEANFAVPIAGIDATGTPSTSTFLRGDGTWSVATGSGAQIFGTPVDDQIAVWTSATVVEGSANLTYSATQFKAGNFVFNTDQTVGVGEDNYVLTYDNATGEIGLEAAAGGSDIEVEDNGTSLTTGLTKLNFVGFNVTEPTADEITITFGVEGAFDTVLSPGYNYTRVDDDTFTVDLANATNIFHLSRRIRFGSAGSYVYGRIASRDFNSTNANDTTVNMTMESAAVLPNPIDELVFLGSDTQWSPVAEDPFSGVSINAIATGVIGATQYWIIVGNGGNIAYSTNAGVSWSVSTSGVTTNLNDVCYDSRNEEFYVVGDEEVFLKTSNGSTYSTVTHGFTEISGTGDDDFFSIAYNYAGDYFALQWRDASAALNRLFKSDDGWATYAYLEPVGSLLTTPNGLSSIGETTGTSLYHDILGNANNTLVFTSFSDTTSSSDVTSIGESTASVFQWQGSDSSLAGASAAGGVTGNITVCRVATSTEVLDDVTFTQQINGFAFSPSENRLVCVGNAQTLGYIDYADTATADSWNAVVNGFAPTANINDVARNEADAVFIAVADNGEICRSTTGIS